MAKTTVALKHFYAFDKLSIFDASDKVVHLRLVEVESVVKKVSGKLNILDASLHNKVNG
jgi:hypothetical protein